jgi:hypothetical protein
VRERRARRRRAAWVALRGDRRKEGTVLNQHSLRPRARRAVTSRARAHAHKYRASTKRGGAGRGGAGRDGGGPASPPDRTCRPARARPLRRCTPAPPPRARAPPNGPPPQTARRDPPGLRRRPSRERPEGPRGQRPARDSRRLGIGRKWRRAQVASGAGGPLACSTIVSPRPTPSTAASSACTIAPPYARTHARTGVTAAPARAAMDPRAGWRLRRERRVTGGMGAGASTANACPSPMRFSSRESIAKLRARAASPARRAALGAGPPRGWRAAAHLGTRGLAAVRAEAGAGVRAVDGAVVARLAAVPFGPQAPSEPPPGRRGAEDAGWVGGPLVEHGGVEAGAVARGRAPRIDTHLPPRLQAPSPRTTLSTARARIPR